jgi:hypothetical protein
VKPGAPVLKQVTIVEYTPAGPSTTDITGDVPECETGVTGGDTCRLVDETPSDGGVPDGGLAKADPALCKTATNDWCRCQGDPSASEVSEWNCAPFAPTSLVIATFDRLIDTTPFESDGGIKPEEIAALTATPTPPTAFSPLVDYSSTGTPTSLVFAVYSPNWGNFVTGNPNDNFYRWAGPSIEVMGAPALPSGSTISVDLNKMNVRAKDGKTAFTGMGLLADGAIKFKTAPFTAEIGSPHGEELPPADPDAGTGATPDGGVTDAAVADGSADAGPKAPPPTTGPVPSDMNMDAVVITFNNLVDMDAISGHITVTEDGKPFTAFTLVAADKAIKTTPTVTITPDTAWAAGKEYTVTVDANAADLTGVKLGETVAHTFVMAN